MCLGRGSYLNISRQDLCLQLILQSRRCGGRRGFTMQIQQVVTSSIKFQFQLCGAKERGFLGADVWRSAEKLKVKDSYGYSSFGSDNGLSRSSE